ncbi:MAG: septum formation initiator family protein [Deltaproteobacteria bacterium]|nr:septum formation initiator family protein [Deltaproteobacteria bacterium]MBN2672657.1 septum formation initiator family protein [Deltaproteobacteria bacterium]
MMSSLWRFIWMSLPIVFLLGTAIYVPMKLNDEDGYQRVEKLTEELETLKAQNRQLNRENETVKQKIRAIQSDDDYIENIARNEMGMIGPNEIIYQF